MLATPLPLCKYCFSPRLKDENKIAVKAVTIFILPLFVEKMGLALKFIKLPKNSVIKIMS